MLSDDDKDLLENLSVPVAVPPQWRHSHVWDGDSGQITTGPIRPVHDFRELLELFGYDPAKVEIVGKVNQWRKEQPHAAGMPVSYLVSYFFGVRSRNENLVDLPALYAEAARTRHRPLKPRTGASTTVVILADPQVGKTDSRGGTPELLERLNEKRAALEAYLRSGDSSSYLLIDVGDGPESFENVPSQAFLNDLSFPDQIDCYATERFKFETLLAKFGPVDSTGVPSNHGAWRNGKQILGKPSDDWGLHVMKRLKDRSEDRKLPITYHFPEEWDESVVIDVRGTKVGVHHGHQANNPDGIPLWWAKQTHGGQAIADADILVTGHFHHLRIQPTGRNKRTGKSKWWIQAPTLDNGSSWWRNRSGDDSDPGLLVFRITDEGLDLQSLVVL